MHEFGGPTNLAPAPRSRSGLLPWPALPAEGRPGALCQSHGTPLMDDVTLFRALAAFCRQRARMDGENEQFWLAEADAWARRLSGECGETEQGDAPAA